MGTRTMVHVIYHTCVDHIKRDQTKGYKWYPPDNAMLQRNLANIVW